MEKQKEDGKPSETDEKAEQQPQMTDEQVKAAIMEQQRQYEMNAF